jgi:hypothetical protein
MPFMALREAVKGSRYVKKEAAAMLPTRERVVMISGASRGIGRAMARRLHEDGYRLSLGMRPSPAATEAVRGLDADRLLASAYEAGEVKSAQDWVAATLARFDGSTPSSPTPASASMPISRPGPRPISTPCGMSTSKARGA